MHSGSLGVSLSLSVARSLSVSLPRAHIQRRNGGKKERRLEPRIATAAEQSHRSNAPHAWPINNSNTHTAPKPALPKAPLTL